MTIAADLLRIALDPDTGRLRHRRALAVGTRAALMAELALAGCLVDGGASPVVTPAPPPEDRLLSVLRHAIDEQPGHRWVRWFTHVSADRDAVAEQLVATELWQPTGGRLLGGSTYVDRDPATVVALVGRTAEVAEFRRTPASAQEAVLGSLAVVCGAISGRPRPRAMDTDLMRLLDVLGPLEFPERRAVQAALDCAATAVKRGRSR